MSGCPQAVGRNRAGRSICLVLGDEPCINPSVSWQDCPIHWEEETRKANARLKAAEGLLRQANALLDYEARINFCDVCAEQDGRVGRRTKECNTCHVRLCESGRIDWQAEYLRHLKGREVIDLTNTQEMPQEGRAGEGSESEVPSGQAPEGVEVHDLTGVEALDQALTVLRKESAAQPGREIALAITKAEEGLMWRMKVPV